VTVHHRYNNINSQRDAIITNIIDNYNRLNMFRELISPIFRSTRLCLQFVVRIKHRRYCVHQQAAPSVLCTPAGSTDGTVYTSRQHRRYCVHQQAAPSVLCTPAGSTDGTVYTSRQHRRCFIHTTNCKHSLVLLRMGEIIARNLLSCM